eukprot:gene30132-52227_t
MRAKVHVFLKPGVLDVQGKAVEQALHGLGWGGVEHVRVGRTIEFDLAASDAATAEAELPRGAGVRDWAATFAALALSACVPAADPVPTYLGLDCARPFEAQAAALAAQSHLTPAPKDPAEPYLFYSSVDGRTSYLITVKGAPGHPAIMMQKAQGGESQDMDPQEMKAAVIVFPGSNCDRDLADAIASDATRAEMRQRALASGMRPILTLA